MAIPFRIALANLRYPEDPEESVRLTVGAVSEAAARGADLVCFPECYVPGYRPRAGKLPGPDAAFLESAWSRIAGACGKAGIAAVVGTERLERGALLVSALVVNRQGTVLGFQDKVQLDPSEEGLYSPGSSRQVFDCGAARLGVVICHEGWRYPETVRWAVRQGAQIVVHPQFHQAEDGGYRPDTFADPANTFHEKAALCRAAENTCYFATVNYASAGSPTTSAVIRPDGTVQCWQPYGEEGLLVAGFDLTEATGLLARRLRP